MASTSSYSSRRNMVNGGPSHVIPSWKASPYLRLDYKERSTSLKESLAPLGDLPIEAQERSMLRSLLNILQGFSATYVCVKPLDTEGDRGDQSFIMDDSLDYRLKQHSQEILRVASLNSHLARFVDSVRSTSTDGMIVQAFAAALRNFIQEFGHFVGEREEAFDNGQLTMQLLYSQLTPLTRPFELMVSLVDAIGSEALRGGGLLSLLWTRLQTFPQGRGAEQSMLLQITKATSAPFFRMLQEWLYEGSFQDPYGEFLIAISSSKRMKDVQKSIHTYHYWENRYKLVPAMVPKFIEPFADKILRSGKYLNIIKQCDSGLNLRQQGGVPVQLVFHLDVRYYDSHIEGAYLSASGCLLNLMLNEKDLLAKLRSFKHFFLLDQDDFIAEFLNLSMMDDLKSPMQKLDTTSLFALFDESLKSSVLSADPYRRMIKPSLKTMDFLQVLEKGKVKDSERSSSSSSSEKNTVNFALNCFTLDCEIEFPLCLIVNDEAKMYYQLLFQNIFRLKLMEWKVGRIWTKCNTERGSSFALFCSPVVQQMRELVKSLQHYFCSEVIDPYWQQMMAAIRQAKTFDAVFDEHSDFIKSCSKDCMITTEEIVRLLASTLDVCNSCCSKLMDPNLPRQAARLGPMMERMRDKLTERMVCLLANMSDSRQNRESDYKLVAAIHRLDFNQYYTRFLAHSSRLANSTSSSSSSTRHHASSSLASATSLR
ncbi:hypothetical protein RvY_18843 [Ramazzottius varieornatus]|uniref:Gamma-tubulin complex component n=1 Tax=Ramazzottius varieornatus TaxID=947166 RepID=A0A1D1WB79_RAMVA|nr:hypothetical protein RvY_18843 [Ramazzottius varieornatus]